MSKIEGTSSSRYVRTKVRADALELRSTVPASSLQRVDREHLRARAARTMSAKPRPFLKWVGSKRSLAPQIIEHLPTHFATYREPFLGGGYMYFLLEPHAAAISDQCEPLIQTYEAVRDDPVAVHAALARLPVDRQSFYRVRSSRPRLPHTKAARFIYLNKTCWNGLYRENARGEFNVPYGAPRSTNLNSLGDLLACSESLLHRGITVGNGDFESELADAGPMDLVYLDPPYATTAPRRTTFLEYNQTIFSWNDQIRLAGVAESLRHRGCTVLVTNSSAPEIAELYPHFKKMDLLRSSTIAGATTSRGLSTEALFVGQPYSLRAPRDT